MCSFPVSFLFIFFLFLYVVVCICIFFYIVYAISIFSKNKRNSFFFVDAFLLLWRKTIIIFVLFVCYFVDSIYSVVCLNFCCCFENRPNIRLSWKCHTLFTFWIICVSSQMEVQQFLTHRCQLTLICIGIYIEWYLSKIELLTKSKIG